MDLFSYLLGKNSSGGTGGDIDWNAIGYNSTPQSIVDGYNYALQIKNNWTQESLSSRFLNDINLVYMPLVDTSTSISMFQTFYGCTNLVKIPQLDTYSVTTMQQAFYGCTNLVEIPQLDTNNITGGSTSLKNVFTNCQKLNNESLNNILSMCINVRTKYTGTRSLAHLGFTATNYPIERIQSLPKYQDFIDAGWTIGY